MRSFLAVFLVVGCGGKDDEGELPPPITLKSEAEADGVDAQVDSDAQALLEAETAISMFLNRLLSDNTVKSTFWTDGQLGTAPVAALDQCWSVPSAGVAGFQYDVDLSGCSSEGYAGMVHVDNTAGGPVILSFTATTVLDWELTGSISFDYTAAGNGTWRVYTSDDDGAATPLSVALRNGSISLTIEGGIQVNDTGTEFDWWGSWSDGTRTIGVGAPAQAAAVEVKPATWLDYRFMPSACACQHAGDVVVADDVSLTEVRVDLDLIQAEDDGIDDPAIPIGTGGAVAGGASLGRGEECGRYVADLLGGEQTFTFDEADLKAAFQAACDLGAINDDGKCTRLQEAAIGASLTVTIPPKLVNESLTEWTEDFLDEGLCVTDMVDAP